MDRTIPDDRQMDLPETLEASRQKRDFLADQFFGEESPVQAVTVEWRHNGKFEATLTDMWTGRRAEILRDGISHLARGAEADTGPEAVKNLFNLVTSGMKPDNQVVFNQGTKKEMRFTWDRVNETFVRIEKKPQHARAKPQNNI